MNEDVYVGVVKWIDVGANVNFEVDMDPDLCVEYVPGEIESGGG